MSSSASIPTGSDRADTVASPGGIDLMNQYIKDVESGALPSCIFAKQAVARHLRDLKNGHKRGLFFDEEAAAFAIRFISMLRHTEGDWKGKRFNLQPFQAFIVGAIFGWMQHIEIDGKPRVKRRFKKAYIEIARKNGKTELAAGIGLLMAFFQNEGSAQVYSAANKKEQAAICFDKAVKMVESLREESKGISKLIQVSKKSIFSLSQGCKFAPLAADATKEDGSNPFCGILDEYHEAVDSSMLEVLETGMGGRISPLLLTITTAGLHKATKPCVILRKVIADVLAEKKTDDAMFGIIFTIDDPEKWGDKDEWIKANPNIGKSPYWHNMEADYTMALNEGGSKEYNFKTKNLNIWVNAATTWIPDKYYKKCIGKVDITAFKGKKAFLGMDLASKYDVAALRICIPHEGKYYFTGKFYLPKDTINERGQQGVAYEGWAKQGWITLTEGNVIDYEYIKKDIQAISEILDIDRIEYDQWNAIEIASDLTEAGHNLEIHPQTLKALGPPTKGYEALIRSGRMVHDDNPVMHWMLSNVVLMRDSNDNYKPDKKRSSEKIDGIIADIMAFSGCDFVEKEGPSIYETRDLIVL